MKIRNIFILTTLILAVFILGACGFLDGTGNQGVININFGDSGGRYAVSDDDKAEMIYKVTLTSPGKSAITKTTNKGDTSVSISVPEGIWNVKAEAEGEGYRIVKGEGKNANVVVAAGIFVPVNIKMKITGTRAHNWEELKTDCEGTDDNLSDEYSIEIVSEEGIDVGPSDCITMGNGKTINLWSKTPVTIKRTNVQTRYEQTIFYIQNGILILDGTKGEIILQGNGKNNSDCEKALINVDEKDGVLEMLNGVTLKDNHTKLGGGVYVKFGAFYMKGGVISGNYAGEGGGVYISHEGGTFIKTGGTIYGEGEGVNSNSASSSSLGHAVYDNRTPWNATLGPTKSGNWPQPK